MKPTNPTLTALLAGRQFLIADLFTFTLTGGTVVRYTDFDQNITTGGYTYSAGGQSGPYFNQEGERAKGHWKAGLEVDTLDLNVIPGSALISGVLFGECIKNGVFDGAQYLQQRAFMPLSDPVNNIAGTIIVFGGRVAEIEDTRSLVTFHIVSDLELLNQSMPRNLYQPACVNTLYDTACTLSAAALKVTGTASTGSTKSTINATLAQASGYFTYGKIKFTSGVNAGFTRGIKGYTQGSPSVITMLSPFPAAPSNGDTFDIFPGCDKKMSTCQGKFSNLENFRGMPFVPTSETAV